MKKYSISEFAQKIRKKHPRSYDDLSDDKLVNLWLKKYPNDKEKINTDSNNRSEDSTSNILLRFLKYLNVIIWIAVIVVAIIKFDYVSAAMFGIESESYFPYGEFPYKVVRKEAGYEYYFDFENGGRPTRRKIDNYGISNTYQEKNEISIYDTTTPMVMVDTGLLSNSNSEPNKEIDFDENNGQIGDIPETKNEQKTNENTGGGDWIKILEGGINLITELSKNREFERRTLPMICSKCNKTIEVDGYYKESTDEFKPIQELPTEWFHTHKWRLLR